MEKKLNQFCRCDDYVDKGVDYSNPIQEKWIHKQVVKITGESEDDFVIEEKPVLLEKVNFVKRIQEEAKGTDLKSLVLQVMRTGDYSLLENGKGSFVDITGYPDDPIEAHNAIRDGQVVLENLPDGLKQKSVEELANMTPEEISDYVKGIVDKTSTAKAPEESVPGDPVAPVEEGK